MKKIYSFVFAAIAILSAASCQKELVNVPDTDSNAGSFTFVAQRDTETKTVLVDGKSTHWTPGDEVSAFNSRGEAVTFSTAITENSASALFSCASFAIPEDYTVHAIYPQRSGVSTLDANGVINNLRVAGTQTAVAGSFDPAFAIAYACGQITSPTVPPTLQFENIHTLFKFTIGGEKAPLKVVLTNGGSRYIAGLFTYNTKTGAVTPGNGAKEISLVPAAGEAFEVGKTYYIVAIGGGNFANVTLKFDDTVVKTVEGAKYADESNDFLLNKIINLGTVSFPAEDPEEDLEPVEPLSATLVKAFQSHGATSYMTDLGANAGKDRNIAITDEYLFIPETQSSPAMWKVSLTDGTAVSMPVGTVASGVTFALSCPRFLKNENAEINDGNDVLVVSSMGMNGEETYLYFYKNGFESDPHKVALHNGGNLNRRLGDKMTLYGTMANWGVYYKEQISSAIINWGGTVNVLQASDIWPAGRNYMDPTSDTQLGAIYFYDYASAGQKGLVSTVENCKYGVLDSAVQHEGKPVYVAQQWAKDPGLAGCHGFNFFKHDGKDYIAYTNFSKKKLVIIEGAASADGVQAALEAHRVVFEASIAADDNACTSGNSAADCSVYQKDGKTLVAGHIQNVGVVVYQLN